MFEWVTNVCFKSILRCVPASYNYAYVVTSLDVYGLQFFPLVL
jgi:hypothetical protein